MTAERDSEETGRPSNLRVLPTKRRVLSDPHRAHLRASGLTDESIELAGFYTERDPAALRAILNRSWQRTCGDGLVIPFFLPGADSAAPPFFMRVRPDQPRIDKKRKKPVKYEQPWEVPMAPYFPARSRLEARYADVSIPLVLTEGEKKGALLDQLGYAVIAATGVNNFHDVTHRDETDGEYVLHALIRKHVVITGRDCYLAFDSDQAENEHVLRAAGITAGMLLAAGARTVRNVVPHSADPTKKCGIDDFFADNGEAATRALFANPVDVAPLKGDETIDRVVDHRALRGIPVDERLRMPTAYTIDRDGTLWLAGDKDAKLVERAPIFISRLVSDLYNGHELVELVFRRDRAWKKVVVPRRTMVDARTIVSDLGPLGAPVDSSTAGAVVTWLRDFEAANERRLPRSLSVSRCGWHTVKGEDVFVLAGEVLRREGSTVELVVDRQADRTRLSRGLRTTGSEELHLDALRRAWAADPVCATVIAAALAAPLLRVLGAPIFCVHLAGDSSRGKSSMLKIASSVYGDPRDEEWVSSWNSTNVGHEQRAAHLCDLPFAIDESGVVDAKDRERAVYMLMNGVGRTRGAKDGGLRETQQWRTVVLSTGEQRLTGEEAATGAQVRILSLQVSRFGSLTAAGVDELRRTCEENFGHLGRTWIETWLETSDDARAAHRAALKAYARAFQERAKAGTANARQAQFWAILAYAESVAFTTFGLGQADGATIARLFGDQSDVHTEIRSASERALERLQHWIQSEPMSFPELIFLPSGARAIKLGERGAPREIHGYMDRSENRLLVLPIALRKYLGAGGIDDSVVLREWKSLGHLAVAKGDDRFTTQVRIESARHRVISIAGTALGLEADGDSGGSGRELF